MCTLDELKEEVDDAVSKFDKGFRQLSSEVISLRASVNEQGKLIAKQNKMMIAHEDAVNGLIEIYETGTGFVKFLKWLSKLLAALATIAGFIYGIVHWRPH